MEYKMLKRMFAALMFSALSTAVMAQSKFDVSGTIIEKETNEAVMSATVRILSLPDSNMVAGTATDIKGNFLLKNVKKGKYALKVSFIGMHDHVISLDLTRRNQKDVNLGYLTLGNDEKMLKEALVTANVAQVQVSGDSLVYNSDAYRVAEGSALEELVKKLPGAEIDDDGNIKINGKSVSKILVDGKEFFLNDKNIALKNIPTNIIDKIKSYDRKSDLSRITGIDDGEEETVLDLSIKKGMKNGWFGNIDLSIGTKERYSERFSINRFTDNAQMTLIGNFNNTGDRGFGGGGGRGGWGRGGNGLRTTREGGFNFATTSPKLESGGNVRYRYDGNDTRTESNTQNFVSPTGAFTKAASIALSKSHNINADFRLEWKPDSMTNIIFRPSGSMNFNYGYNTSDNATFNENPTTRGVESLSADYIDSVASVITDLVVNSNYSRSQSYSNSRSISGELQVNRKLNTTGRNITFRATGTASGSDSKNLSASRIKYYQAERDPSFNNRYNTTPGRNYRYSLQATYSEPIADRTYLQFSYRFNYSYNMNDRQASLFRDGAYNDLYNALEMYRYDIDGAVNWMIENTPYRPLGENDTIRARELSQYSKYQNFDHTISFSFRRVRENYNLSVGVDLLPQHSTLDYKYMGKTYDTVKRTVFNFSPTADFRYNWDKQTQLRVNYRSRTSQPSMTNLLDITDDSNPLNITKGNPGLKPSFNHNLRVNFNTYNVDKQMGIFSWIGVNVTQNSIANRTSYDSSTGVRTTKPENINGNWNGDLGFGLNSALDKQKLFTASTFTRVAYTRQVSYLDPNQYTEERSKTDKVDVNERLSFGFRKDWFEVSVNGNLGYSHSRNNVVATANLDTWNFGYGAEMNLKFDNGIAFSTDISQSSRRGFSQASMNTNELLWNAQISYSFLKGRALTISAQWNDILANRSNISRNITAMMSSDSKYNSIYSYGMLHVIYKLNIFGGKNAAGTGQGGPGGPGGFGGGGFGGGRRPF